MEILVASIGALGAVAAALVAHKAERNTRPVSNGWTGDVVRRLDNIETLLVDHVTHHPH